jgi:hypothetical protein
MFEHDIEPLLLLTSAALVAQSGFTAYWLVAARAGDRPRATGTVLNVEATGELSRAVDGFKLIFHLKSYETLCRIVSVA